MKGARSPNLLGAPTREDEKLPRLHVALVRHGPLRGNSGVCEPEHLLFAREGRTENRQWIDVESGISKRIERDFRTRARFVNGDNCASRYAALHGARAFLPAMVASARRACARLMPADSTLKLATAAGPPLAPSGLGRVAGADRRQVMPTRTLLCRLRLLQ
jgi:hypothetical protein